MSQVRTDILLNGMRLEINPSKLTKCGEIHINDDCTNAFLFCAFCSDVDEYDLKLFKTLEEFIDHIRWHRSDDYQYPDSPSSSKDPRKCGFELIEDDSRSNLSAPRHDADDITDWIAPPEELFELDTIGNFIEIEQQPEVVDTNDGGHEENSEKPDKIDVHLMDVTSTREYEAETMTVVKNELENTPEITGEVLIELLDLLKKCPCLWHVETAAKTSPEVIEGVYSLLAVYYNICAQQTKSPEYVRGIITQIKDCFLEDYKDVEYSMSDSLEALPWYFPYLKFLLKRNTQELDKSIFTDFLCPMCQEELATYDSLWEHLCQKHLEVENDTVTQPQDITTSVTSEDESLDPPNGMSGFLNYYPREIVDKFIEIYRSQTRLWDKSNDEYLSRPLRQESYDMLLKILQEFDPTASQADVVKKINSLRTQFSYEQRMLSNNSCKSMPWIYEKLKFLVDNVGKKTRNKPPPPLKARPSNFKIKVKNPKCPICALSFTDPAAWLSHMQSGHTSNEYQSEDGFFYCKICGWQNKTKELLMRHIRNRHTHNLQRCTDCNLGFRLLSMLAEHRAKVHNDFFPFKCEICDEGFATRSRLRNHSVTHWCSEDLPHKCEHCGAKFSNWNAYTTHVRHHKVEIKYSCEICNLVLRSKAELRQHTRTHLNECPDVCDTCGKAFRSAQLLTDHLNEVHGGVTFPCSKCDKEFKSEKLLADHFEGHELQHPCDICGTTFFRKTSLRKHQRLKHNSVPYDHIKYDCTL